MFIKKNCENSMITKVARTLVWLVIFKLVLSEVVNLLYLIPSKENLLYLILG
jgi:hypothetical protein